MSTDNPLISILMPYYKFEDMLVEAVNSVRAQTYSNWELIVVDDCSPTVAAKDALATINDARIKIFRHPENLGNAQARNTAASHSKGDFFLPLDSDDLLSPDYIEKTLNAIKKNSGCSAAFTDVSIFGMHTGLYTPRADLGDIFCGHYPHNTLLMKREVYESVGGYKRFESIVDTEFWISAIEIGTKFTHVPEPLYHYRRHENSFSRTKVSIRRDWLKVLLHHQQSLAPHFIRLLRTMVEVEQTNAIAYQASGLPTLESQYRSMHNDFHDLLQRYTELEKKAVETEQELASIRKLTHLLSQVTLKNLGLG